MKTTKLILAAAAAALLFASCEKEDTTPSLAILTFEDQDYKGESYTLNYCNKTISTWSDLIDEKQNNGELLYNDKMTAEDSYWWHDKGNTELKQFMGVKYWSGGHAISNYVKYNYDKIDYDTQLAVYVENEQVKNGGHNGSRNFAVHTGYTSYAPAPFLEFGDGKARVIDHMWVNNTAITLAALFHGDDMTGEFGAEDWFKIVATGYNGEEKTGTAEFFLGKGAQIVTDWTLWDLSGLGEVTKIQLDMQSTKKNDYGMTTPAYFAYDDVAVRVQ